jgi:hypothetical protein
MGGLHSGRSKVGGKRRENRRRIKSSPSSCLLEKEREIKKYTHTRNPTNLRSYRSSRRISQIIDASFIKRWDTLLYIVSSLKIRSEKKSMENIMLIP